MTIRTYVKHARSICPHCHQAIDVSRLEVIETAENKRAQHRICPDCDEPIVLAMPSPESKINKQENLPA